MPRLVRFDAVERREIALFKEIIDAGSESARALKAIWEMCRRDTLRRSVYLSKEPTFRMRS
jgi:hypothetical protein